MSLVNVEQMMEREITELTEVTRRKPAPLPLCPTQILRELAPDPTRYRLQCEDGD